MTDATQAFQQNHTGSIGDVAKSAKKLFDARKASPTVRQFRKRELESNARALADGVKAKPIPPLLIAVGIGAAAVLLFNKRARGAALAAGTFALDQYRKQQAR